MKNPLDFEIGNSHLCESVRQLGFARFFSLAEHVRALPYARTAGADAMAVLREGRGTCSSKHRLLASIAHDSGQPCVQLTIGIYEMSERNTPGLHDLLKGAGLPFIPEAHCYLTVGGERFDFTGLAPSVTSPFDSLLLERFVLPDELPLIKNSLHRQFLDRWAKERDLKPEDIWNVREACIAALSHQR